MGRVARVDIADEVYHVINRAVGRLKIFEKAEDYRLFITLLTEAKEMTDMRILSYVVMPNHWHLQLYPRKDKDLGLFMHWLTNAHTRRVHSRTKTIGHGPLVPGPLQVVSGRGRSSCPYGIKVYREESSEGEAGQTSGRLAMGKRMDKRTWLQGAATSPCGVAHATSARLPTLDQYR